jgi:two-component system nitrate/nitrite response regulator NarL
MVFTKMQSRAPDRPKPARVLLVDDNEAILTRAARVLTPGCAVVGAVRDGKGALEAAHTLQPEVIVLDISMPDMNGFDVAACLRNGGSTAALVFLSVYEDEELIRASKHAGGMGYVVKQRLTLDLELAVGAARVGRPFISPTR